MFAPVDSNECELYGLAISPGLAVGPAWVHKDILHRPQFRYTVAKDGLDEEWKRIETAMAHVDQDLMTSESRIEHELGHQMAVIFEAHRSLLHDPKLTFEFERELQERRVNAEEVVKAVLSRYEQQVRVIQNGVLSERGDDIADLARRLLRVLSGSRDHSITKCPQGSILVARHLFPSECVHLNRRGIAGVVIERGGATSHAALLTREMGIPAVSGVAGVTDRLASGERLLVDGNNGTVIVRASPKTLVNFTDRLEAQNEVQHSHLSRCHEPAVTEAGQTVRVMANVGCKTDITHATKNGADGIGLYRIEHHFLSKSTLPSEHELYEELHDSLESARGLDITMRLLDTGGDKTMPWLDLPHEPDPFLGRRGVRFLLAWPELLRTQLRVLCRLSEEFRLKVLVPMVTMAHEVRTVRSELEHIAAKLEIECPPLGTMIETPAAALCTSEIAKHCDFLSIGSNDLTQYTMVAGRENPLVADYFNDEHLAVLRLIRMVCSEACGCPVSVCGELAASPSVIDQLLKFGIETLSVAPPLIPQVKEHIRHMKQEAVWTKYC